MFEVSPLVTAFGLLLLASAGLSGQLLVVTVERAARSVPAPSGHRGRKRREARRACVVVGLADAPLTGVGALLAKCLPRPWLQGLDERLAQAGEPGGLNPQQMLGSGVLSAMSGLGLGLASALPPPLTLLLCLAGAYAPFARLVELVRQRQRCIARSLPEAIDQVAMCMQGGLDFPGAVRALLRQRGDPSDPLMEELGRLLEAIGLGHTRSTALAALARRVPIEPVRELAAAITQADRQGTPLGSVLLIQARMLRMRRGVLAEEMAARAAVLLTLPLLLLLATIMTVMFGPFIVGGALL